MLRLPTAIIATILLTSTVGLAPQVLAAPEKVAIFGLFGDKKKEGPADVLVTQVEIAEEDIVGTIYYTLKGKVLNRSEDLVLYPLVHYEIYAPGTERIVKAGVVKAAPERLPSGQNATFEQELSTSGQVKITTVRWQTEDKALKSHAQMERFP